MSALLFTRALAATLVALPIAPSLALGAEPPPPPGLAAALLKDRDVAGCARRSGLSATAFAAKAFDFERVTLDGGAHMTVATGANSCLCAVQNCPTFVLLAERDGAYRTVLSTYALGSSVLPDGSAVLTAHDSALVADRTTYRWNGTTYTVVKAERVDQQSGAVKPMSVPIAFAPGTFSASVAGKAAVGFGDTYTLRARAGQTLALRVSSPRGTAVGGVIVLHGNTLVADVKLHWSGKLPATGEYAILVEGATDSLTPYHLTMTIR